MCSLCRLPVAKNHDLGQLLAFWGLLYRPLLPIRVKFGALEQTHGICLHTKFRIEWVYTVALCMAKNPNFVVSPVGGNMRKMNTGAQLTTFPYPTVSKSFLSSSAFMAKSRAESLMLKSVTDRQTDSQRNRQTKKLNVFGRPGGG